MIKVKQPGVMTRYNSLQVLRIVETLVIILAIEMTVMQYTYEHIKGKVILMLEHHVIASAIIVNPTILQNAPNPNFVLMILEATMEKVIILNETCLNVND